MVAGVILAIGAIVAGIVIFREPIAKTFAEFNKTDAEKAEDLEQKKIQNDRANAQQKLADERGLLGNATAAIFGNKTQTIIENAGEARILQNQVQTQKDAIAKQAASVNLSPQEFEKATDTNLDVTKFNPKGIIGYGVPEINNGKGLLDTPANREILAKQGNSNVKILQTKRFGSKPVTASIAPVSVIAKRSNRGRFGK